MNVSWRRGLLTVGTLAAMACAVDPTVVGDAMIEGGEMIRADAAAQEPVCPRWEVAAWRSPAGCLDPDTVAACAVPDGWEPLGSYGTVHEIVFMRRCAR